MSCPRTGTSELSLLRFGNLHSDHHREREIPTSIPHLGLPKKNSGGFTSAAYASSLSRWKADAIDNRACSEVSPRTGNIFQVVIYGADLALRFGPLPLSGPRMATGRLPGHLISLRTTLSGDDPANISFFLPLGGVPKWMARYSNTSVRATSERHNQKPSRGSAAGFIHWKNSTWNPGVLCKAQRKKITRTT